MTDLLFTQMRRKRCRPFVISSSAKFLDDITHKTLPGADEVFKFISLTGGIASISFVKWVADKEPILELDASTLRIGQKQFYYLSSLATTGKLKKARFFVSTMQKEIDGKTVKTKYDYAKSFARVSEEHQWKNVFVNNHSKIILMRTEKNFYVLETSSNLNENPKIEQYSFENNAELYYFYKEFFNRLEAVADG